MIPKNYFLKFLKKTEHFVISFAPNTDLKRIVHMRMEYSSSKTNKSAMQSSTAISLKLGSFVLKVILDVPPSSAEVRLMCRNMLISTLITRLFFKCPLLTRFIYRHATLRLAVRILTSVIQKLCSRSVLLQLHDLLSRKITPLDLSQCRCQSQLHPIISLSAFDLSLLIVENYSLYMVQKLHTQQTID